MKAILLISSLLCAMGLQVAANSYFPIKTTDGSEGVTAFESKWYGMSLKRMKEPRLPELAKDPNVETYRFLILPTWGHSIAVRVQKRGEVYSLSARRLDGDAGYDPGKLVESKDFELGPDASRILGELIQDLNFFQMPVEDNVQGMDGDESIIEGVSRGKYHVVQRWCASDYDPQKRGLAPFNALRKFLIDESTLSERPENKVHRLL
jgi:hypothetical protein